MLARSLDGGETLNIEDPGKTCGMVPNGIFMAMPRTDLPQQESKLLNDPINFAYPQSLDNYLK